MSRYKLTLLVSLLILCAVPRCFGRDNGSRGLVSPKLLRAGQLEMLWQNELPIKKSETLERLLLLGDRIYAFSDRNYMVSLNRENGSRIFSRSVAPIGFPLVGLELYNDELLSVIGNKLVEIDSEFGIERRSKRLLFGVSCPVVRNGSYCYIAGIDRRIRIVRAYDKVQVFEVATEDDSMVTSIIADEEFVVFSTDGGNVVSMRPDEPVLLWEFDAADGIVGPIVRDEQSIFAASKDTNLYRLNLFTGELIWKYQTGAVLERSPRVTREVVYQYVRDKGLTAIDIRNGKFMWQLAEGVDLLAEANARAYVITNAGTLAVMDNKKLKQLYSINLAGVSRYAANTVDSKIYIADEDGRIACLRPVE